MALAPPDLQTLLAQLLQEQQQNRAQYMGQQQSGYAKAGAALGMGLNRLFGGSDTEQAMRDPRYLAGLQKSQAWQGLNFSDKDAVLARVDTLTALGDASTAEEIYNYALERWNNEATLEKNQSQGRLYRTRAEVEQALSQNKISEQQAKTEIAQIEAEIAGRVKEFTVAEQVARSRGASADAIRADAEANVAVATNRASQLLGSITGDVTPDRINAVADALTARGEYLAADLLRQRAAKAEKEQEAKSVFERSIAHLPKAEQQKLLEQYARNYASRESTSNVVELSPAKAQERLVIVDELAGAQALIGQLKGMIAENPSAFGSSGSVKKGVQAAAETIGSLTNLNIPLVPEFLEKQFSTFVDASFETAGLKDKYAFDPDVATLSNIQNALIFAIARARQPEGRLLARTLELAEKDAKLTGFTGPESVDNRLTQIYNTLEIARANNISMFNAWAPEDMKAQIAKERGWGAEEAPQTQESGIGGAIDWNALEEEAARRGL